MSLRRPGHGAPTGDIRKKKFTEHQLRRSQSMLSLDHRTPPARTYQDDMALDPRVSHITTDIFLIKYYPTNTIDTENIRWFHIIYSKRYKDLSGAVLKCHLFNLFKGELEYIYIIIERYFNMLICYPVTQ